MVAPTKDAYLAYLEAAVERRRLPGLAAQVTRGGETLFTAGVGLADREAGRPVTPNTIFGVGSITKSFTALAVMQLADAGALRVDDAAADYLPALARSANRDYERITLHHLLTNTSGLPPLPYLARALARSVMADPARELIGLKAEDYRAPLDTVDELVEALADAATPLVRPPGTIFSYSNDGFAMLGRVVEVVSGLEYEAYVRERILTPLGMTRSLFAAAELAAHDDVTELYSYVGGFERVERTPGWWEAPAMTSAGFLKSTATDMTRYAAVYLGERPDVISPAALAQMTSPHARTGPERWYGYGVMVQPDYRGRKLVEHGGNIKGVGAWFGAVTGVGVPGVGVPGGGSPAGGVTSVVLANITGGPVAELALGGVNLALGAPLDARRVTFAATPDLTDEQLERFAGVYRSAEGTQVTVGRHADGKPSVRVNKDELPTRAVSDSALLLDLNGQDALVEFIEPTQAGFAAVTFGYRVLERQA